MVTTFLENNRKLTCPNSQVKLQKSAAYGWLKTERKDPKASLDGGFESWSDPS